MSISEKMPTPVTSLGLSLGTDYHLPVMMPRGEFHLELISNSGELLESWVKPNTLTEDAAKLAAWLFTWASAPSMTPSPTQPLHGLNGLAVGTGTVTEPSKARQLGVQAARVLCAKVAFKDTAGQDSTKATNIVDFTFVLGAGVADGSALQEMGLVYISGNVNTPNYPGAADDIRGKDILINYLKFPVINKPSGSTLNITWRLTF